MLDYPEIMKDNGTCFCTWQLGTIVMRRINKLAEDKGITIQDAIRTILYQYSGYPGEPVKPEYHAVDTRFSISRGHIFVGIDDDYIERHIYPICQRDGGWTHPMDMMSIHLIQGALQC